MTLGTWWLLSKERVVLDRAEMRAHGSKIIGAMRAEKVSKIQ